MSTPDILASKRPGFLFGRVKIAFNGRMSRWKKGERIKIWSDGRTVTIERVKWTGSLVPLAHCCYGVQRSLVEFDVKGVEPLTKADEAAFAILPAEGWFSIHKVPYLVRNPRWRCDRLVEKGVLESRVSGRPPTVFTEWRKK